MVERRAGFSLDKYLRREDTSIAKVLKKMSKREGASYRSSRVKRLSELAIATPWALTSTPIIGVLSLAARMEEGGSGFYVQERIGRQGNAIRIVKIKTMCEGSDGDEDVVLYNSTHFRSDEDPRNTALGRVIRKWELEELPQLWQVVQGKLALVEIRINTQYFIDLMARARPRSYTRWSDEYQNGKPGLVSLNAAISYRSGQDKNCYHYDLLYAKKASLGLDFYILWRLGSNMIGKVKDQILGK